MEGLLAPHPGSTLPSRAPASASGGNGPPLLARAAVSRRGQHKVHTPTSPAASRTPAPCSWASRTFFTLRSVCGAGRETLLRDRPGCSCSLPPASPVAAQPRIPRINIGTLKGSLPRRRPDMGRNAPQTFPAQNRTGLPWLSSPVASGSLAGPRPHPHGRQASPPLRPGWVTCGCRWALLGLRLTCRPERGSPGNPDGKWVPPFQLPSSRGAPSGGQQARVACPSGAQVPVGSRGAQGQREHGEQQ